MRLSALLLSSVATLGLVAPLTGASVGAAPPIHRAAHKAADCPAVWFLGARGSGEKEAASTHEMGPEVNYMASVVKAKVNAEGLTFGWLANLYSADSVDDLSPSKSELLLLGSGPQGLANFLAAYKLDNLDKYDASIAQGIAVAELSVQRALASCPNAQIIVAGYSQGAIVTHNAENFLARHDPGEFSHIVGTLLLGDGDRVPDTKARLFGTAPKDATGIRVYLHAVKSHDVPAPGPTAEIANNDDLVADFAISHIDSLSRWKKAKWVHTKSYDTAAGQRLLAAAAAWVASKVNVPSRGGSGNWSVIAAPVPPRGEASADFWDSTCGSVGVCVAAGHYTDESGNQHEEFWTLAGGRWSVIEPPVPRGGEPRSEEIFGISCGSGGVCAADGLYSDQDDNGHGALWTFARGRWSVVEAPVPPGGEAGSANFVDPSDISGLSCGSGGVCAADGPYTDQSGSQRGALWTLTRGRWSVIEAPVPRGGEPGSAHFFYYNVPFGLGGVSGYYTDESGQQPGALWTLARGRWSVIEAPVPRGGEPGSAFFDYMGRGGISCGSGGVCAVAGSYIDEAGRLPDALWTLAGGRWSVIAAPVPPGAAAGPLAFSRMSCGSSGVCAVDAYADEYLDQDDNGHGALWAIAGGRWSVIAAPVPPGGEAGSANFYDGYDGISCGSGGVCAVAGSYTDESGNQPGALWTLVGGRWSVIEPPVPRGGEPGSATVLGEMYCGSGGVCGVDGQYTDQSGSQRAARWTLSGGS